MFYYVIYQKSSFCPGDFQILYSPLFPFLAIAGFKEEVDYDKFMLNIFYVMINKFMGSLCA